MTLIFTNLIVCVNLTHSRIVHMRRNLDDILTIPLNPSSNYQSKNLVAKFPPKVREIYSKRGLFLRKVIHDVYLRIREDLKVKFAANSFYAGNIPSEHINNTVCNSDEW